jgi:hypothetical protein
MEAHAAWPAAIDKARCAAFLAEEEHRRGQGGILYVRGDEWAYLLPHEWPGGPFREALEELHESGGDEFFFLLVKREADGGAAPADEGAVPHDLFRLARRDAARLAMEVASK